MAPALHYGGAMTRIDDAALDNVCGGAGVGEVAKAVGSKAGWVINAGTSAYAGYATYSDARAAGKGVGASLGEGTLDAVKSFTLYDLWSPLILPTPAY